MRISALRAQSALAALVGVGVAIQIYLIAAYLFHAGSGALSAHKAIGFVVLILEILVFAVALPAWPGHRRAILLSLSLPVVGVIQIAFAGANAWVGALHGLGALAVLGISGMLHVMPMKEARRTAAN
jgi:hypothetical protein